MKFVKAAALAVFATGTLLAASCCAPKSSPTPPPPVYQPAK